jgi:hypothetical protein
MASMKTTAYPAEPHPARSPFSEASQGAYKSFVESVEATVTRRVAALVDMLAWVRIELAAEHPDGLSPLSDQDRIQRALVQVEMALAMTRQLANELDRRNRTSISQAD